MKALFLALFTSLFFLTIAHAQTSAPVYVSFNFQVPSATNNISDLAGVEAHVSQRLADKCADAFPYWTLLPGEASNAPVLKIWLSKDGATEDAQWSIQMKLLLPRRPPKGPWRGILFAPTDFTRLAASLNSTARWAEIIEQHFESDLLAFNVGAIQATLQINAPIGKD